LLPFLKNLIALPCLKILHLLYQFLTTQPCQILW